MKQSAYERAKDAKAADNPHAKGYTPELMCSVHGCPNRWTASIGNLCSAHFAVADDKNRWPEVTQEQQWGETERARARGETKPAPPARLSMREKRDILLRLRDVLGRMQAQPRAWIGRLEAEARAGATLTAAQRHALQEARGGTRPVPIEDYDA